MENKRELSFEEKLAQLEKIVSELENGDVNLDKAIDKYSEAMKLIKQCSETLDKSKEKVSKILTDAGLEDFKVEV